MMDTLDLLRETFERVMQQQTNNEADRRRRLVLLTKLNNKIDRLERQKAFRAPREGNN